MKSQHGQVILILILVMTVALAIGLSVIQRSLSDISTSSKVEQSSRAYSAAEAGIERAIQANADISGLSLGNNATVDAVVDSTVPDSGQALEYSSLSKEDIAHVWLANPGDLTSPYGGTSIDIYWGDSETSENPAIEVTIINNNNQYKKFFNDSDSTRISLNKFAGCSETNPAAINTSAGSSRTFLCKAILSLSGLPNPVLLRARILYSNTSQPVAVKPASGSTLPPQAKVFTATGQSGQTQRKVQVVRLEKVVPFFFDYAVFSVGDISK